MSDLQNLLYNIEYSMSIEIEKKRRFGLATPTLSTAYTARFPLKEDD
jgi:hypothetical protein